MNPVNATSLYVSASRSVLQCDPRDPRSLAELCRLLPFFRQSLSCLVCGNLLQDPIAPTDSSCQHYVCGGCKGQRMQLKPSCSWCKDYSRFQENRQLSLLVHCYRKLCLYITQSPLAPHIAAAASDSPDLRAVLNEGLAEAENEAAEAADDYPDSPDASQVDSPPEEAAAAQPDDDSPAAELRGADAASPASTNGLHDCNGLLGSDVLRPVTLETDTVGQKTDSFSGEVAVGGGAGQCDIGAAFGDELKHGGGSLLLSVEEVLRTLDSDSDPTDSLPSVPQPSLNGPHCRLAAPSPPQNSPRPLQTHPQPSQQPPPQPAAAAPHEPPRCLRKRSRSESDSEKVQPLPISTLIRGPPAGANSSPHHPNPGATTRQEPRFPAATPHPQPPPPLPLPNGGPLKVGKTLLVPNKALKKTAEHHGAAKKASYAKARQGATKARAPPRDRVPPHPHPHPQPHPHPIAHPPSPSKPLYKKPVEKKGCKCGRATQNPSVLTCRGQRCPCYSNRKACLDCICRGCQNSYMANGEKKLEAFAVPEKALEQTRLTLGINLTSIAAAALRSPASSSPALLNVTTATGAPVTTAFLSGDNRGFDDSLEMRFDC